MRRKYEVTVRGDWERFNTLPDEVTFLRQQLRRMTMFADHFDTRVEEVEFVVRRQVREDSRGRPFRYGPFEATVQVRAKNPNLAMTRAFREVRDLVQDLSCRPPRMTLDRERSHARRLWEA